MYLNTNNTDDLLDMNGMHYSLHRVPPNLRPIPPTPPSYSPISVEFGDAFSSRLYANPKHEGEDGDDDVSPLTLQLHGPLGYDQYAGNQNGSV